LLRAQLLSIRSFRLGSSRRGAVFSLIVAAIWYGFWALVALAAFNFTSAAPAGLLRAYLPAGFLIVFLYWQVAPMMSASMGASLDFRKLLVYPIPHRKLFFIEVLLRLTTCVEMLLVMAGGLAGLLLNPAAAGWGALPRLAPAVLLFVAFNLLLAAGLRSLLERLLSRKRVREAVVLLMVTIVAAPRLLMALGVEFRHMEAGFAAVEGAFWPWSAMAAAALGAGGAGAPATLAAWSLAAFLLGRWQFERSLRYDVQAAQATTLGPARPRPGLVETFYRLPGALLPDPLGAMVEKELRSLSRTPRFRMVFIMGFTFGLVVWLPLIIGRGRMRGGPVAENFLVLVSVYALTLLGQVSYWNSFGFDRSAAQVYFSLPVQVSKALAGKNIAAALFILLELAAVVAAVLALRVPVPPLKVLEAFVVTPVAALYLLALGNLSSVHFPRAMNPERGHGGSANRFQGLLFVVYPLALLPVFLAYVARYAFASHAAFWAVLAFAAALGGVFYWIAMDSAVETAHKRRELILSELAKGEGPVITE
jgi:ABC-2 type transport system permease protein